MGKCSNRVELCQGQHYPGTVGYVGEVTARWHFQLGWHAGWPDQMQPNPRGTLSGTPLGVAEMPDARALRVTARRVARVPPQANATPPLNSAPDGTAAALAAARTARK